MTAPRFMTGEEFMFRCKWYTRIWSVLASTLPDERRSTVGIFVQRSFSIKNTMEVRFTAHFDFTETSGTARYEKWIHFNLDQLEEVRDWEGFIRVKVEEILRQIDNFKPEEKTND